MALFSRKPKMRKTPEGKLVRILNDFAVGLVLDVGANVGQTHDKLRIAGYKGRIVSFEPVPSAYAELVARAKQDNYWDIAPRTAIGSEQGEVNINVSQATDMSSILKPGADLLNTLPKTKVVEQVVTPVTTLDAVWETYCPPSARVFLKVDTQGFERQVLDGARASLCKVIGIQLELSLFPLYEGEETYLSYLNDLHAWGFEPQRIWENYFFRSLGRQLQIDVAFMRTEQTAGP